MAAKHCLAPVISQQSSVLILGSLPGDRSLEKQQYYANPKNQFWKILAAVFGATPGPMYAERVEFILNNKLALWDVLGCADREGSLDSSIKNAEPNDFLALFSDYPGIAVIALNGGEAARRFRPIQKGIPTLFVGRRCVELPSSSGVPGKNVLSLGQKIDRWKALTTADQ